jgi:tRNA threonylcarbamoyl adenosine modification protein YeaZ
MTAGPASGRDRHDGGARPLLVIDTATSIIVVGTATRDGELDAASSWPAGHRHGETLLPSLDRFLAEQNVGRSRLAGIIVGTGPGAFTGLRVGLATAKGLALGLGIPLVGISTGEALLAAAAAVDDRAEVEPELALLLPAGPWDRVVVHRGRPPRLVPGDEPPDAAPGRLVAVDLVDRAPADAVARGERARTGLLAALARLGAARFATSPDGDDLTALVPEYVTLPRGVRDVPGDGVALTVE